MLLLGAGDELRPEAAVHLPLPVGRVDGRSGRLTFTLRSVLRGWLVPGAYLGSRVHALYC